MTDRTHLTCAAPMPVGHHQHRCPTPTRDSGQLQAEPHTAEGGVHHRWHHGGWVRQERFGTPVAIFPPLPSRSGWLRSWAKQVVKWFGGAKPPPCMWAQVRFEGKVEHYPSRARRRKASRWLRALPIAVRAADHRAAAGDACWVADAADAGLVVPGQDVGDRLA